MTCNSDQLQGWVLAPHRYSLPIPQASQVWHSFGPGEELLPRLECYLPGWAALCGSCASGSGGRWRCRWSRSGSSCLLSLPPRWTAPEYAAWETSPGKGKNQNPQQATHTVTPAPMSCSLFLFLNCNSGLEASTFAERRTEGIFVTLSDHVLGCTSSFPRRGTGP